MITIVLILLAFALILYILKSLIEGIRTFIVFVKELLLLPSAICESMPGFLGNVKNRYCNDVQNKKFLKPLIFAYAVFKCMPSFFKNVYCNYVSKKT